MKGNKDQYRKCRTSKNKETLFQKIYGEELNYALRKNEKCFNMAWETMNIRKARDRYEHKDDLK